MTPILNRKNDSSNKSVKEIVRVLKKLNIESSYDPVITLKELETGTQTDTCT